MSSSRQVLALVVLLPWATAMAPHHFTAAMVATLPTYAWLLAPSSAVWLARAVAGLALSFSLHVLGLMLIAFPTITFRTQLVRCLNGGRAFACSRSNSSNSLKSAAGGDCAVESHYNGLNSVSRELMRVAHFLHLHSVMQQLQVRCAVEAAAAACSLLGPVGSSIVVCWLHQPGKEIAGWQQQAAIGTLGLVALRWVPALLSGRAQNGSGLEMLIAALLVAYITRKQVQVQLDQLSQQLSATTNHLHSAQTELQRAQDKVELLVTSRRRQDEQQQEVSDGL
jgi:hypothetical protein